MSYQNPDGSWSYKGSTVKYASAGAADYYGSRDASYVSQGIDPTKSIEGQTVQVAGTNIKTGTDEAWAFYGLDPKTGTISAEKLEQLKTGYLPGQMINAGQQRKHKIRKEKVYTQKEIDERGIRKAGGKVLSTFEQRKVKYTEARKEGQAQYEYEQYLKYGSLLGISTRNNPYSYENLEFPRLKEEVAARDIRQSQYTVMEVGEGGQQSYTPKSVQILQERKARREATAMKLEYQKQYGNINPQISEEAYRPMKDLGTTEIRADNQVSESSYKPMTISKTGLDKVNALRKSEGLPPLESVKALIVYDKSPGEQADEIIREAQKQNASKIQFYTDKEPVGAAKVEGSRSLLISLLQTGQPLTYSFTIPKDPLLKAQQKKEREEFKEYIKKYNKMGTGMFDIYQGENLATRTSSESPYYDYFKAQQKFGEVSITPTKAILFTNKPQPIPEEGSLTARATRITAPFYNLGVEAYYGMTNVPRAELGLPISKAKEEEASIYSLKDPFTQVISTGQLDKRVTREDYESSFLGNALLFGMSFIGGKAKAPKITKAPPKVSATITKAPTTSTYQTVWRPTNPTRTSIPKDIFKFDIAEPPKVSASRQVSIPQAGIKNKYIPTQPPKPPMFESTTQQTQSMLSKIQSDLIAKPKGRPRPPAKPKEQPLPELTNPLGRRGIPPIKTKTGELSLSRAEVVEQTAPKLSNEYYSFTGQKKSGTFGDAPKPEGALLKVTKEKIKEPPLPELTNPLGRRGKPPIQTKTDDLPLSRADVVEQTRPKLTHEYFKSTGKKGTGTFGDAPDPLGALIKSKQVKLEQPLSDYLGTTKRSFIQRKNKAFSKELVRDDTGIPAELLAAGKPPIKSKISKDFDEFRKFQTRIEREQAQGIFTKETGIGALGKGIKIENVKEVKGYEPSLKEFQSRLGRTKSPKTKGKIDTNKLLGIEEEPTVGAPKEFQSDIKKLEKNLQEKSKTEDIPITPIKTKDLSKTFKPSSQDYYKPTKADVGLDIGKGKQQTIQIQKEKGVLKSELSPQAKAKLLTGSKGKPTKQITITKPILRKKLEEKETPSTSLTGRSAVVSRYTVVDETTYLHKDRPRPIVTSKNIQKTFVGTAQQLSPKLSSRHLNIIKTSQIEIPKQKQRESYKYESLTRTETLTKTEQTPKQKQTQKQVLVNIHPQPNIPATKLIPGFSQTPKQTQKITTKPIWPKEPPTTRPTGIFIPPPPVRTRTPIEPVKSKPKIDFIGNAPTTELVGLYKRPDIIYGKERTRKLARKDIFGSKKGDFTKTTTRTVLRKPGHTFTEKKQRRSKRSYKKQRFEGLTVRQAKHKGSKREFVF